MKYNILINQYVLAEFGYDVKDGALLDYLAFYCSSQNIKIIKRRICDSKGCWTWINLGELLRSMPMLRIKTKGAVSKRISKLVKDKFFRTKKVGDKLYFQPTAKLDLMLSSDQPFPQGNATVSSGKRNRFLRETNNTKEIIQKDNTSRDASVAGNQKELEKQVAEIIYLFEPLNPLYKTLFSRNPQRQAVKSMIEQFGFDNLCEKIKFLPKLCSLPCAPRVTTPIQLANKLGEIKLYIEQNKNIIARKKETKAVVAVI